MKRTMLAAMVIAVAGSSVWADYDLSITVLTLVGEDGGTPQWHSWTTYPTGTPNGNGSVTYEGEWAAGTGAWWCAWNVVGKADPFVSANITFRNTTPTPQIYSVSVIQPIFPPITPSSLIGGSTGGSLTDTNFDGAGYVKTALGAPLYMGGLDGVGVLPIYPHPTTFSISFPGQTVTIPALNPGLPGPTIPAGPVSNWISITHTFELSPGDSVGFTSFFVVVPEPAIAVLLAFGSVLMLRRQR